MCVEQVLQVKGVIEATNPEFPAAQLKLIHSGQILKDESTLAEYKIKEDEFLVCMVTKVSRRSPRPRGVQFMHGCVICCGMVERFGGAVSQRAHTAPCMLCTNTR